MAVPVRSAAPVRPSEAVPRRVWVEQVMGMPVSVHLRGAVNTPAVDRAVSGLYAELRAVEKELSPRRPDSDLNRLRRGELLLCDAGTRLRRVVQLCETAREQTEGWFDAFYGLTKHPDATRAVLDRSDPTGQEQFDPTGLVKGWAVELAAIRLETLPEVDHCVNAGGDITVGCALTDTPDWVIGIEDPTDRDRIHRTVSLRHGGIATSGTAARGAHILRPDTGGPATQLLSATVIGPSLTWADIHATAAFAQGPPCLARLRSLRDHVAFLVDDQGITTQIHPQADPCCCDGTPRQS